MRPHSKRTLSGALAVSLAVFLTASSAGAAPANEAEARARYSRGVELYNDGAYSAALVELERAQALAPHYGILHSIGLVKVQLADFVGAIAAFEEYLTAGGDELSPQRRQETKDKIAQLQERIGTLDVTVTVEGAEVVLDESIVGLAPLNKPVRVNPGKHEVIARRPGEKGESKRVSIAGGDRLKLVFDLTGGGKSSGGTDKTVAPGESGAPKWVISTWIAAGVFAAGATATGLVALSRANDLKDARDGGPNDSKRLNELSSDVKTWALVTDALAVPAIILTAVSLYYTLRPSSASPEAPSVGKRRSSPPSANAPTFSLGRFGLSGTF